jgi:predicted porin
MMKKTLVALAAVAVAGGAFAQATMTGAIAYGFESDTTSSNVTTSGFGMEDAEINFAVSEDIEGLGKLSAGLGIGWGGRASTAGSNDSNITLTLLSGLKIAMKSEKAGEYLTGGIAGAGANFEADLTYLGGLSRTKNDTVAVSFPVAEGITVTVKHSEPNTETTVGTGSAADRGTVAATSTDAGLLQRHNTASLDYKAGALTVNAAYRSYDDQIANSAYYGNTKSRFSAAYDLGVAKIGAGVDQTNYTYGNTKTATLVGATVPVGSLTLGVQLLSISAANNASSSSNYTRNSVLAGGQYNLSKRTYVTGQFYGGDVGGTSNQTGYLFSLYNTF